MEDFLRACQPRWVKINGDFNPRGGIKTTVTREYKKR
jgi:7-cyano-7-deazaguanine reductase